MKSSVVGGRHRSCSSQRVELKVGDKDHPNRDDMKAAPCALGSNWPLARRNDRRGDRSRAASRVEMSLAMRDLAAVSSLAIRSSRLSRTVLPDDVSGFVSMTSLRMGGRAAEPLTAQKAPMTFEM